MLFFLTRYADFFYFYNILPLPQSILVYSLRTKSQRLISSVCFVCFLNKKKKILWIYRVFPYFITIHTICWNTIYAYYILKYLYNNFEVILNADGLVSRRRTLVISSRVLAFLTNILKVFLCICQHVF